MGIKCGIVGLPNVGKSSLINILSEGKAEAANYPFCTIEPNVGVVMVPDSRLDQLSAINDPEEVIPSIVEFVDIAGLVEGASQGEGLGNKFLANIRETDAIIHVVRCFEDKNVTHVSDEINPVNDFEIINTELLLASSNSVLMISKSFTGLISSETWVTFLSSKHRTTWMIASVSRMFAKNLFPRPSPCEAPSTNPAISTNSTMDGITSSGSLIADN